MLIRTYTFNQNGTTKKCGKMNHANSQRRSNRGG